MITVLKRPLVGSSRLPSSKQSLVSSICSQLNSNLEDPIKVYNRLIFNNRVLFQLEHVHFLSKVPSSRIANINEIIK